MAPAFKCGTKEHFHHSPGLIDRDKTAGHDTHIGIVMLTSQAGNFFTPTKGGPHPLMLVEGNVDTVSTPANGNSGITHALFYGTGHPLM